MMGPQIQLWPRLHKTIFCRSGQFNGHRVLPGLKSDEALDRSTTVDLRHEANPDK